MKNLKVTFHLDGTGIFHDPQEPIHLDSLLVYACAPCKEPPSPREEPQPINIPCAKWRAPNGIWGWRCSALQPEGPTAESVEWLRKKFDLSRVHLIQGATSASSGRYKEHSRPLHLTLAHRMVGYLVGDREKIRSALATISHLGKKRSSGRGKIIRVEMEECLEDWSCVKDGLATRFLPSANGWRVARALPPYWHTASTTTVCEVGDEYGEPLILE